MVYSFFVTNVSKHAVKCKKIGLIRPQNREEQAHCVYHENAVFQAKLHKGKKKTETDRFPFCCVATKKLI